MAARLNQRSTPAPIQAKATPHNGLPANLKTGMEALSGIALDEVRVHRNSARPAQLHAQAYAHGTDIHLAPGQERHLPHEAWHVVQQKQGRVRATAQLKGKPAINDDPALEREADVMGARAMAAAPALAARVPPVASPSDAPLQCTRITNELDASDVAWGAVEDRTVGVNRDYGGYADKILGLDNSPREPVGFLAAKGVRHWTDNYRNKSLAYLTELETAFVRTAGPRLAAPGSDTSTEPDLFTFRDNGDVGLDQSAGIFGGRDHTEIKRTEGQEKQIKALVREATAQLIERKDDNARRYIVEMHAPNWYPNQEAWQAMEAWAIKSATKKAASLKTGNAFAFGSLIIRIYYAQATVPVTASVNIPHRR
jgi:hypothetical protein